MLVLFKKDLNLFVKVRMNLRIAINYQNKVFNKGMKETLLLPEEVEFILTRNGNITMWNGVKYIKLNLGQFYDIMKKGDYKVEELIQPKKEVKPPVVQPKVEEKPKEEPLVQPKKEVKPPVVQPKVEEKPKEEPVVQPKVEEKVEKPKEVQNVENKKQRHKQGGDK